MTLGEVVKAKRDRRISDLEEEIIWLDCRSRLAVRCGESEYAHYLDAAQICAQEKIYALRGEE